MHAAPRHGTPSLTSEGRQSELFWSFIRKVALPVSDPTQPCLTSAKLVELAGPLCHSPSRKFGTIQVYVSSLRRGHTTLLCIVPILVYVTLKLVCNCDNYNDKVMICNAE